MVWFSCAAFVALFLDQLSKWWIRARLDVGERIEVWPGWFHFEHVQNTGAAWGMLAGRKWLLVFFTLTVTALVVASAREVASKGRSSAVGFGLILGGALGNLFDRLNQSYVTDFIDLDTPLSWLQTFPVFNVADSSLSVGVALLLLSMLRQSRSAPLSANAASDAKPPVIEPQP